MPLTPSGVLYPPSNSTPLADLNWATAMMRFFESRAQFERLLQLTGASPECMEEDDRYAIEALTHEATHRLQLCLTGFAYDFSYRLLKVILNAAQRWSSLDDVNRHRRDYLPLLSPIFETLDRQGPRGLTPRILMESAAYLAQKITHYPNIGSATYERLLTEDEVEDEYVRAYDVASHYLGADTLEQFTHVANLALATSAPERVFVPLLELFRDHGSRLDIERNHSLGMRFLNSTHRDILLGSSMDRIEGGDVHPILASTVIRINELANAGKLNLVALFTHGRVFDRSLARIIVPPTFFRPSAETGGKAPIWLPDGWRLFADGDQASHIEALRWLMVVSLVLEQDLPEIEPPPRVHHAGVRLGHQLDMPLTARMWECARENRNKATIDRMTQLLGDIGKDPRKARTLRGTVAITFPGREFAVDESPFLDRGVQAFLRELFDRIPYLMYFLSDAPHAAAVLEVYAAYAPNSLIRRPNAAVAATFSEDALAAFAILLHNAGEFALQQGEPREIILGHLNAIPTEIRDLVRQMILRAALLE